MPDTKLLVGILLIFSPLATIALGAVLGQTSIPALEGFISIFDIIAMLNADTGNLITAHIFSSISVLYPAVGYFISTNIKLNISIKKANSLFCIIFTVFGLLNIFSILNSWSYSQQIHGQLFTYGFSIISIACYIYFYLVIKIMFATQIPEKHWKAHGLFWFWFSALAFPYMGEVV